MQYLVQSLGFVLYLQCNCLAVLCFQTSFPSHGQRQLKTTATRFKDRRRLSKICAEAESANGASAGLATIGSSLQSQLASAFSALDESDQYDAVLTGLCAKILDSSKQGDAVSVALQDPIQLLEEMNARRVKASGRSLMSLIDVSFASTISFQLIRD
jgi:hypothetical protein